MSNIKHTCVDRFLEYIKFDTQSKEDVEDRFPSTEKQKELSKYLVNELTELGIKDAKLDEYGYVTGTLPSNTDKDVSTIGFIAHVDTSPEVSGKNVKAIIHKDYQGGDIALPGDKSQIIKESDNPWLKDQIGHDIITSDGTTLLGADNKAGVAIIMDAINHLVNNPSIKHGDIKIGFTPDEEVGNGTKYFDVEKFGAKCAYTIDGGTLGEIEMETFCADTVILTINGINVHPGYAKDKMVNAIKVASDFVNRLPKDNMSPETTADKEGYVHPHSMEGGVDKTVIKILIRDFIEEGLKEKEDYLKKLIDDVVKEHPGAKYDFEVKESYRNMKYIIEKDRKVYDYAVEAIEQVGIKPIQNAIRGGTDGARLSFEGLPTPNVFTGGHNFHSKLEWISVEDMQKSVETVVKIIELWEERS